MSKTQTMNSRRFTCAIMDDPDHGPLTILTLRQVVFAHTPIILTSPEVVELRELLRKWAETGANGNKAS